MKLTNREKILLPSVLIILLATLFIYFVYIPLNEEAISLQLQSDELNTQIQEAKSKQVIVNELNEQVLTLQKDIEMNNEDMLKIWDQTELLVFVEKTMTSLCEHESIDFFDVVSADALQAGDVNVVINTNYNNLQSIWKKLEKANYFNTISNFSMKEIVVNSEGNSNTEKDLEVSMDIRFYSINLEEQFPEKYDFMSGSFGKTDIFK